MNGSEKGQKFEEEEENHKYRIFITFQPAAAPALEQHEVQRQTPWQGLGENHQHDSWSATCLAFAGWCCNKTRRCRILGN